MYILRKIGFLLFIFTFLFQLVGCSGVNRSNDIKSSNMHVSEKNSIQKDKIKLQYAQWSIPLTMSLEKALQEYNEKNDDGIQVELLKIPRANYNDTLNMLLSSGEGPDVFEARSEWLFSYIYKNWIYDLTGEVDESFLNGFPEWVKTYVKDPKFKGYVYSVPSGQVTYRLIYNKDLFKRAGLNPSNPPATLDDMVYYARKITEAGKGDRRYGFALALNDVWSGLVYPMEAVNAYSGVYYFNFRNGRYDLAAYTLWLDAMIRMKAEGSLFPGETAMKDDLALIQFAEGNLGMMYAESWKPVLLKELFPAKCDWAVAMPPAISLNIGRKEYVGISSTGWQVVYGKSKNLDKAVLFWKYLYSQEFNKKMYESGSFLPTIKGVINDGVSIPDVPKFKDFLPGKNDTVYPATPLDMDECSRVNVFLSVFNGNLPLQKGLTDETNRLNMQLDKYSIAGNINLQDYTNPDFLPSNNIK